MMNDTMKNNTNMDDDMTRGDELETLRERMRSLRERLNAQQLVSDTLLRDVVRHSTDYSRRYLRLKIFLMLPVAALSMCYLYFRLAMPLWFLLLTIGVLLGGVIVDWHTQRLTDVDYGSTSLLEIQERFVRQKRLRARRMCAGMVLAVVWILVALYVMACDIHPAEATAADAADYRSSMFVGGLIGGIVGLCLGLGAYFKMQRKNEKAIRMLRDFSRE